MADPAVCVLSRDRESKEEVHQLGRRAMIYRHGTGSNEIFRTVFVSCQGLELGNVDAARISGRTAVLCMHNQPLWSHRVVKHAGLLHAGRSPTTFSPVLAERVPKMEACSQTRKCTGAFDFGMVWKRENSVASWFTPQCPTRIPISQKFQHSDGPRKTGAPRSPSQRLVSNPAGLDSLGCPPAWIWRVHGRYETKE